MRTRSVKVGRWRASLSDLCKSHRVSRAVLASPGYTVYAIQWIGYFATEAV